MDFGWTQFATRPLSPSLLAIRGREIIEKLRVRGIRIPTSNRLEQAVTLLERINGSPEQVRPENGQLLYDTREAFRTLLESFLVVHAIHWFPNSRGWYDNEQLAYLLEGATSEQSERNPRARNAQFELVTAAILVSGGIEVTKAEPDLRMPFNNETVGVAIKRVRSLNEGTLRTTLRDASHQIISSVGRGFIALNLDSWLAELDTSNGLASIGPSFNHQMSAAHRALEVQSARDSLIGYFIFATWFGWVFGGPKPRLEFHAPRQIIGFVSTGPEAERFREFFRPVQDKHHAFLASAFEYISVSA